MAGERVAVQRLDGDHRLLVVGHRHEAVPLALGGGRVADHFHALHGPERTEQLPQHAVVGVGGQVVHEDAPAGASLQGGRGGRRRDQSVSRQRAEPLQPFIDGEQGFARGPQATRQVRGRRQRQLRRGRAVCAFHGDGGGGAGRHRPVQLGYRALRLHPLIEPDERDSAGRPLLSGAGRPPGPGPLVQDPRADDAPVRAEQRLQLLLAHVLRQPGHVQVRPLDGLGAGPRERHLDDLVLQPEAVERGDGLLGVLGAVVVDERVPEALPVEDVIGEDGHLVADQLAALDLADAREQRAYLLLGHRLRQVVDDQVGLGLLRRAGAGAVVIRRLERLGHHVGVPLVGASRFPRLALTSRSCCERRPRTGEDDGGSAWCSAPDGGGVRAACAPTWQHSRVNDLEIIDFVPRPPSRPFRHATRERPFFQNRPESLSPLPNLIGIIPDSNIPYTTELLRLEMSECYFLNGTRFGENFGVRTTLARTAMPPPDRSTHSRFRIIGEFRNYNNALIPAYTLATYNS